MHGCKKEREGKPRRIGPYLLPRCPNYYLKRPDALRDEAINVYQDYKAGVLRDWPDEYAGAISEGVRLIDREINASEAEVMKARAADNKALSMRSKGG